MSFSCPSVESPVCLVQLHLTVTPLSRAIFRIPCQCHPTRADFSKVSNWFINARRRNPAGENRQRDGAVNEDPAGPPDLENTGSREHKQENDNLASKYFSS